MTTIGGPGGIGGSNGPTAPDGTDPATGADDITGDVAASSTHGPAHVAVTTALDALGSLDALGALGAELTAGRLTPHEVTGALIDRLVEATGGPAMDATERAELRELLTDLVTNDPYLGGLVGRI
ncbi:MAG TPA: hypothetical protein VF469_24790 [Kofleriaceae bacterium]